ncbi:MAG: 4Fe-4S binding protein [Clostridia bacterium]|nr:4Fe-4S binding protein [Clostridia bacterium]
MLDETRCKGCGLCAFFCSRSAIDLSMRTGVFGNPIPVINGNGKCNGCGVCIRMCPDLAILYQLGE